MFAYTCHAQAATIKLGSKSLGLIQGRIGRDVGVECAALSLENGTALLASGLAFVLRLYGPESPASEGVDVPFRYNSTRVVFSFSSKTRFDGPLT